MISRLRTAAALAIAAVGLATVQATAATFAAWQVANVAFVTGWVYGRYIQPY